MNTYTVQWIRESSGEIMACSGLTALLVFRRIRELLKHESRVTILSLKRDLV